MARGMRIAVSGAVVVGGVAGGLAALHSSPEPPAEPPADSPMESPRTAPAAEPAVGKPARPTSPAAPAPPMTAPPDRRDPKLLLATQMTAVLGRFVEWSRDHAGAPCPDHAALGVVVLDPWGHPIELTCTEQPADQVVGAVSAGPDGIAGNDDDVTSWTLGAEVTDLVRGARWSPAPAATAAPPAAKLPAPKRKTEHSGPHDQGPKPGPTPGDAGTDDIPARR